MTDDERALLLALAKAVYKDFSTGPVLIPDDERPSGDEILALIRKFEPTFNYDWQRIIQDARPKRRWWQL